MSEKWTLVRGTEKPDRTTSTQNESGDKVHGTTKHSTTTHVGTELMEMQNTKTQVLTSASKKSYIVIRAECILQTPSESIHDGALVYTPDEPIVWVGKFEHLPHEYKESRIAARVSYLMAGLWDVHVHLTGSDTIPLDDLLFLNPYLAGARTARDLAALLNAGYTSVRELAGNGWATRQAVKERWIPGPNIYSSVSMLSQTAGHGDAHKYPLALVKQAQEANNIFEVCDGVDECIKAVRRKIRQGADVIKIAATGGVLSLIDDPEHQQFSMVEMRAIVDEAARAGRIVCAHCHGKAGIVAALEAGVKVIEHGSSLDDECCELMKSKGAMLVATRSISQFGVEHPEAMPPEIYRKMVAVNERHRAAYACAVRSGVKCALGTDLGVSSDTIRHNFGMDGREIGFALEAGMSGQQVIEALTANAPDTLGPEMKPCSGLLRQGYEADFIAVAYDPRGDVRVLMDQDNITHVWKTGRLYKAPGHPVGFFPVTIDEIAA